MRCEIGDEQCAPAHDQQQWPTDALGQFDELVTVPARPYRRCCTGRKLKSNGLNLRMRLYKFAPSQKVLVCAPVEMECSRDAERCQFLPANCNALHVVEVVGSRHIAKEAEIG